MPDYLPLTDEQLTEIEDSIWTPARTQQLIDNVRYWKAEAEKAHIDYDMALADVAEVGHELDVVQAALRKAKGEDDAS